jgi:hypothetical protein
MHAPQEFIELANPAHDQGYENEIHGYWQQCEEDAGLRAVTRLS